MSEHVIFLEIRVAAGKGRTALTVVFHFSHGLCAEPAVLF
jgi:hypothetical protein